MAAAKSTAACSSTGFYPDWDLAADITGPILCTDAGRDPHDKDLHDLVGELSTRGNRRNALEAGGCL